MRCRSDIAFFLALGISTMSMITPIYANEPTLEEQTETVTREVESYFDSNNPDTLDYLEEATAEKIISNKAWLEDALQNMNFEGFDTSSFAVYNNTASMDLLKVQYATAQQGLAEKGFGEEFALQQPQVLASATNAQEKFKEVYGDMFENNQLSAAKIPDSFDVKGNMDSFLATRTETYKDIIESEDSTFNKVANNISIGTENMKAAEATKIDNIASLNQLSSNVKAMASQMNTYDSNWLNNNAANLAQTTKNMMDSYLATNTEPQALTAAREAFAAQTEGYFSTFSSLVSNSTNNNNYSDEEIQRIIELGLAKDKKEAIEVLNQIGDMNDKIVVSQYRYTSNNSLVDEKTCEEISRQLYVIEGLQKSNYTGWQFKTAVDQYLGGNSFQYSGAEVTDDDVKRAKQAILDKYGVYEDGILTLISTMKKNNEEKIQGITESVSKVKNVAFTEFYSQTAGRHTTDEDGYYTGKVISAWVGRVSIGYTGYNYSIQIGGEFDTEEDIQKMALDSSKDKEWLYFPIGSAPYITEYEEKNGRLEPKLVKNVITYDEMMNRLRIDGFSDWTESYSRIKKSAVADLGDKYSTSIYDVPDSVWAVYSGK